MLAHAFLVFLFRQLPPNDTIPEGVGGHTTLNRKVLRNLSFYEHHSGFYNDCNDRLQKEVIIATIAIRINDLRSFLMSYNSGSWPIGSETCHAHKQCLCIYNKRSSSLCVGYQINSAGSEFGLDDNGHLTSNRLFPILLWPVERFVGNQTSLCIQNHSQRMYVGLQEQFYEPWVLRQEAFGRHSFILISWPPWHSSISGREQAFFTLQPR